MFETSQEIREYGMKKRYKNFYQKLANNFLKIKFHFHEKLKKNFMEKSLQIAIMQVLLVKNYFLIKF